MNRGESKASMERRLECARAEVSAQTKVIDYLREDVLAARANDEYHRQGCGELDDYIDRLTGAIEDYITGEAKLQIVLAEDREDSDEFEFEGDTYDVVDIEDEDE